MQRENEFLTGADAAAAEAGAILVAWAAVAGAAASVLGAGTVVVVVVVVIIIVARAAITTGTAAATSTGHEIQLFDLQLAHLISSEARAEESAYGGEMPRDIEGSTLKCGIPGRDKLRLFPNAPSASKWLFQTER